MALAVSCVNIKLDFISFINTLYRFLFVFLLIGEVTQATNCCNLQHNIVALQVEKQWLYYHLPTRITTSNIVTQQNLLLQFEGKCCLYYWALREKKYCPVRNSNPLSLGVFLESFLTWVLYPAPLPFGHRG